jgi:hypothetical protein
MWAAQRQSNRPDTASVPGIKLQAGEYRINPTCEWSHIHFDCAGDDRRTPFLVDLRDVTLIMTVCALIRFNRSIWKPGIVWPFTALRSANCGLPHSDVGPTHTETVPV